MPIVITFDSGEMNVCIFTYAVTSESNADDFHFEL